MSDLLQNVGIFVCVGALILVALAVFGVSSLFRRRNQDTGMTNREPVYDADDRVFNERGSARPQYDDRDVRTAGGFGVPATGGMGARDYGTDDVQPRKADDFMDLDDRRRALNDDDDNDVQRRPRRRADDDDVRSSGGFGG